MTALIHFDLSSLSTPEKVEAMMPFLLKQPQEPFPVLHHFGPGVYVRECHMPAGTLVVGHHHKAPHLNIVLAGRLVLIEAGVETREVSAGATFVSQTGRKIARVVEPTVWQNVVATNLSDVEAIEGVMFDKGPAFDADEDRRFDEEHALRAGDRLDFAIVCREHEVDDAGPHERRHVVVDNPKTTVRHSPIHGRGLFAGFPCVPGEVLGKSEVARWVNHSRNPNAVLSIVGDACFLVAQRPLRGCVGGDHGEEVTIDYRLAHEVARRIGGH